MPRKAKPTVLKMLEGNPGKRPLNKREPRPPVGLPEPPEGYSDEKRRYWYGFGEQLERVGVLTTLDAVALELMCDAYAEYKFASAQLEKSSQVWVERVDPQNPKIPRVAYNPWYGIRNGAWKRLMSLLNEFGMTPAARSGLVAAVEGTDPGSEILDFINAKKNLA